MLFKQRGPIGAVALIGGGWRCYDKALRHRRKGKISDWGRPMAAAARDSEFNGIRKASGLPRQAAAHARYRRI